MAVAAVSLNLIMGYGNMPSLAHSVFLGIGAYVVGACSYYSQMTGTLWLLNGFFQLTLVLVLSAGAAAVVGAICLRTRGVYFLMTSLALGQVFYVLAAGAYQFGGDDGMALDFRSWFPLVDLGSLPTRYIIAVLFLAAVVYGCKRLVESPFGLALRATRMNPRRVLAVGTEPSRVSLVGFVISGIVTGLAGFLLANQTDFISPSILHWTTAGDLMIAIAIGGLGTTLGPVYGTIALLTAEEVLSSTFTYWQFAFGVLIVAVARFAPSGAGELMLRLRPRRA
jgi:branched-chain amino acid transport system permease protein